MGLRLPLHRHIEKDKNFPAALLYKIELEIQLFHGKFSNLKKGLY